MIINHLLKNKNCCLKMGIFALRWTPLVKTGPKRPADWSSGSELWK